MRRLSCSARFLIFLSGLVFLGTESVANQQPPSGTGTATANGLQPGVYLVFPFENAGSSPRFDWLGEGLEELTIQRLAAAGEQVYSHAGRLAELERYGLPSSSRLSRATMLRAAEDLDADFVIFGKFTASGTSLTIESRVLRGNPTRLLPPIRETGTLDGLMALHLRMLWRMLASAEPRYSLTLAEFSKRQRPLRLDAFEHYIRGLLAGEDDARLRELREAARLEPEWPDPDFALGEVYFTRRDCNSALPWYARLPKTHDRYPEGVFVTGVCRTCQKF
jgi:TolB-like protein